MKPNQSICYLSRMLAAVLCVAPAVGQVSDYILAPEPMPAEFNLARVRIANSEWANRGLRTPGDAVQTYLWVLRKGDLDALLSSMPEEERPNTVQRHKDWFQLVETMQTWLSEAASYKPTVLDRVDAETVQVILRVYQFPAGYRITPREGDDRWFLYEVGVELQNDRGEWKLTRIGRRCMNSCMNVMRQICAATTQVWIEKGCSEDDVPTKDELQPYLKGPLKRNVCPDAGQYTLGSVNHPVRCSIHGEPFGRTIDESESEGG